MFSYQKNTKSAANSKEKPACKSPITNSIGYTNYQDSIINNYNVKVNITKKKTKNISIGNLTLNNLNMLKGGRELCSLNLTANTKLDNHIQKSENISPKSSDKNKHHLQYFNPEIKNNANTVLNSPKQSYNKIISKMKKEFEKIASRTNSKTNTNEENNTTNTNEEENNNQNIKVVNEDSANVNTGNNKKNNRDGSKVSQDEAVKQIKKINKGIKLNANANAKTNTNTGSYVNVNANNAKSNISGNNNGNSNNNVLDMTTSNITSHKFLLKPHLTTNYSRQNKKKNSNNDNSISNNTNTNSIKNHNNNHNRNNINIFDMSNINKINSIMLTNDLNASSILNTKDITTQDKSIIQISPEITFTINNKYSSTELHTALMAMSNDLSQEKEAHIQTIQDLKDSQLGIKLLNQYITSLKEVYMEQAKMHQAKHRIINENKLIEKHNAIVNGLAKENKELKGAIYKMLFYIEKDYNEKSKYCNRIESIVDQLIKENAYLRTIVLDIKPINLVSYSNTQDKDIGNLVKGKIHKRQDTQIVNISDSDTQQNKKIEDYDHLSHSMKEIKSLKKTMQKEVINKTNSFNASENHNYWFDMKKKTFIIKRQISYLKKKK